MKIEDKKELCSQGQGASSPFLNEKDPSISAEVWN
mgnify:CR=1 FL=1